MVQSQPLNLTILFLDVGDVWASCWLSQFLKEEGLPLADTHFFKKGENDFFNHFLSLSLSLSLSDPIVVRHVPSPY